MTNPTPELVTAERASEMLIDLKVSKAQPTDWFPIHDAAPDLARTVIALHEALAAEKAKIAELEAGASRSLFALMTDRALAAEARALAAEARVAVLEARAPVAWTGREGYFTTDPRQASAHAHHGTPLTPLYASAALETGDGDES